MTKLVFGVGFNDGKFPVKVNGKQLREYMLWRHFLERSYCPKYQEIFPTYIGCSASENFKLYSYFHDWCQSQIGFAQKGFQLDKDLLLRGSKVYSEDTCLFLPSELNNLLISSKVCRGGLPIGVSAHRDRFKARCCNTSRDRHIGYFDTPELAFQAYKQAKEAFIKRQAEKWRAFIDPRAYEALIAYTISITD